MLRKPPTLHYGSLGGKRKRNAAGYVARWEQIKDGNYGLLLWGRVGTCLLYTSGGKRKRNTAVLQRSMSRAGGLSLNSDSMADRRGGGGQGKLHFPYAALRPVSYTHLHEQPPEAAEIRKKQKYSCNRRFRQRQDPVLCETVAHAMYVKGFSNVVYRH